MEDFPKHFPKTLSLTYEYMEEFPKKLPKHFRSRNHGEKAVRSAEAARKPLGSRSEAARKPLRSRSDGALRSHDGAMAAYVLYE